MLRDPRANAIPRDIRRREIAFARALPDRRARHAATARTGDRGAAAGLDRARAQQRRRAHRARSRWTSPVPPRCSPGAWRAASGAPGRRRVVVAAHEPRPDPQRHLHRAGPRAPATPPPGTSGTGEIRGSTTNATRWGSLYVGDGIFKSADGGVELDAAALDVDRRRPQIADPVRLRDQRRDQSRQRGPGRGAGRDLRRASTARSTAAARGTRSCPSDSAVHRRRDHAGRGDVRDHRGSPSADQGVALDQRHRVDADPARDVSHRRQPHRDRARAVEIPASSTSSPRASASPRPQRTPDLEVHVRLRRRLRRRRYVGEPRRQPPRGHQHAGRIRPDHPGQARRRRTS